MVKTAARDAFIVDELGDPHPARHGSAFAGVEATGSPEQHRPRETSLAPRVVGAGDVVTEPERRTRLVVPPTRSLRRSRRT